MTSFTQPSGYYPVLARESESCTCGPYILALLSLQSAQYAKEWIRWNIMRNRGLDKAGRRKRVGNMYMDQMVRYLNTHNIGVTGLDDYTFKGRKHNPTLTQWFANRPNKEGTYIILLGRHFILVQGKMVICRMDRWWIPMTDKRRLKRARVWQVVEVHV